MELSIVGLAMKFWQWTVLIAVVIVAAIINFTDKRAKTKLKFNYKGMPNLQPVPIKTKGKGFWKGIVMWLLSTRNWVLTEDWKYNIDGTEYVIAALPLGGYVKMLDEREGEVAAHELERSFNRKSVWRRFAIVASSSKW